MDKPIYVKDAPVGSIIQMVGRGAFGLFDTDTYYKIVEVKPYNIRFATPGKPLALKRFNQGYISLYGDNLCRIVEGEIEGF